MNLTDQPFVDVEVEDATIRLLGTAHVSRASVEAVEREIETGAYDLIAIELCHSRHASLTDPEALRRLDLFRVIKDGKVPMVMASLALGAFQKKIAEQFGIEPGAEMLAAIKGAGVADIPLALIDREIGTTLKRVYRGVPWWQRFYLATGLFASVISRETFEEADIERLKEGDMLESMFAQFAEKAPPIYAALIDERDRFMAARLSQEVAKDSDGEPVKRVLAIVGAGHLKGIAKYLRAGIADPADEIEKLDVIPAPSRWPKLIPWLIVALIGVGFAIGFKRSPELGMNLVVEWILINGGLSALGTLIAGGHVITIITAFLAAPLTSLNPTIGAGFVTGLVEAYVRKPTVGDFDRLRDDATTFAGWRRNRVARTFLVFFFSTLGSAIGTYLAGFRIFEKLTQ